MVTTIHCSELRLTQSSVQNFAIACLAKAAKLMTRFASNQGHCTKIYIVRCNFYSSHCIIATVLIEGVDIKKSV